MAASNNLPRIRVSENRRYLITEEGAPFFWLGDTAWELVHRLTRQEIAEYLANRQQKRFTVIQAVILAEEDGLNTPNMYGDRPLHDNDPARPNEAYFALVDEALNMAAEHGLYVGLLPTWGDKVNHQWGAGPIVFNEQNAYTYGRFLGERYRNQSNILWVLGGDRPPRIEGHDYRPIWRAMAAGLDAGAGMSTFKTYHPTGGNTSTSAWLHDEPWLDMHMVQSGHGSGHDTPIWQTIEADLALPNAKPTMDAEPNYEDHPVNPWPTWDPALGYFRDHDVRKQVYRSVFAGACGVTYGHHAVWQFASAEHGFINHADRTWREALDRPAATQMRYLRDLIESRPYLTRVGDQGLVASPAGTGAAHVRATRDEMGSYAFVYLPEAAPVRIDLGKLAGARTEAHWYDPRTGGYTPIGEFAAGVQEFTPPAQGPDWVLVLDAA